ncbi:hypothetical protein T01_7979 [Trichinella spiralis]|uniref:Uncharacterized protein n=1 Tax=Trichinella spiralis TaxID=6334 RepID=A0A0V1BMP7_TRISP|nr:hypothetical protein T01_7979 [Trichinella spiralis]
MSHFKRANRFFEPATQRLAHQNASVVPVGKLKENARSSSSKRPTTSQINLQALFDHNNCKFEHATDRHQLLMPSWANLMEKEL